MAEVGANDEEAASELPGQQLFTSNFRWPETLNNIIEYIRPQLNTSDNDGPERHHTVNDRVGHIGEQLHAATDRVGHISEQLHAVTDGVENIGEQLHAVSNEVEHIGQHRENTVSDEDQYAGQQLPDTDNALEWSKKAAVLLMIVVLVCMTAYVILPFLPYEKMHNAYEAFILLIEDQVYPYLLIIAPAVALVCSKI